MDWGFVAEDFEFMIDLEPKGCFTVFDDTRFIGLTTTISYGRLGWIGNVIVEQDYRNRGAGSILIEKSIDFLKKKGAESIGLYSYTDTTTFYESLGFKNDKAFMYLTGSVFGESPTEKLQPMSTEQFVNAVTFDERCVGASREKLLKAIYTKAGNLCYSIYEGKEITGFIMTKVSPKTLEVGPITGKAGTENTMSNLLNEVLGNFRGFEIYLGIPENKLKMISTLNTLRVHSKFKVVRMYYGEILQDKGCGLAMESLERG